MFGPSEENQIKYWIPNILTFWDFTAKSELVLKIYFDFGNSMKPFKGKLYHLASTSFKMIYPRFPSMFFDIMCQKETLQSDQKR